jgi:hypothetical protein
VKKYFGLALIIVAIISLLVWAVSFFIQPILPVTVNNGLVLFFIALISVVGVLSQFKDITEFFQSLFENPNQNSNAIAPESSLVQSIRERVKFLHDVNESSNADEVEDKIKDLIEFVEKLQQGDYFAKKLREITHRPRRLVSWADESPEYDRKINEEYNQEYREKLIAAKDSMYSLIEELIKLQ